MPKYLTMTPFLGRYNIYIDKHSRSFELSSQEWYKEYIYIYIYIYIVCHISKEKGLGNGDRLYIDLGFDSIETVSVVLGDCQFLTYIIIRLGGAHGVVIIVVGMDTATWVQILDETDCISHSTNTLGEGMNPIILPPAMGK